MTIVPWSCGKLLVWDATCHDTFAPFYLSTAVLKPGAVAEQAENRKMSTYSNLNSFYLFIPLAVETCVAFGPLSMQFIRELSHQLKL